jgi:hypothetical protein
MDRPSDVTKLLLCAVILAIAFFVAWRYLRPPAGGRARSRFDELLGERPWRRLGAGIAMVLALMFVAGVYVVDIPDRPRPYAIYWIIMLGLVVWLCALALKDALHTRRTYRRWQHEKTEAKRHGIQS